MAKNLEQYRYGKEFVNHARCHNADIRNGGKHCVVSTPRGSCAVPVHPQELGKGLRMKLVKTFIAIGLALVPLAYLVASRLDF